MLYRNFKEEEMRNLENIKEVTGIPPLTLPKSKGKPLKDYKVYGNSTQDGTPAPNNPIEIESVGERTYNVFDTQDWYTQIKEISSGNISKVVVDGIPSIFYKPTGATASGLHYMEGQFKANTQYSLRFRAKYISGSGYSTGFVLYYTDGSNLGLPVNREGWQDYSLVSTANKTISYIRMSYNYAQGCYFDENSIQVAEGNTVKDYKPYGYEIPVEVSNGTTTTTTDIYLNEPLRKIGNYADYIDYKNQKVIRNIESKEIETRTLWDYGGSAKFTGGIAFRNTSFFPVNTDTTLPTPLCTHNVCYKSGTYGGYWLTRYNNSNQLHFGILYETMGATEEDTQQELSDKFNAWITSQKSNGNPVTVIYPLTTPTQETITLPQILTAKGNCILSIDTEVNPSNMWIKYIR